MRNKLSIALSGLVLMGFSQQALAVDWPSLQGLEGQKKEKDLKLWGFIQADYNYTKGTDLQAGPFKGQEAAFNRIAPGSSTETFNVRRARLGLRGQFDYNKINYFLLSEFGNNGITQEGGAQLTDASVTLNHIPGMHIRLGQFKTPGGNEAMKAIHTFDWNNFTNATDQLLLERFTNEDGSRTKVIGVDPVTLNVIKVPVGNDLNGPVGAFRDIGIQAFNTFKKGDREFTYAAMLGNGNGINRTDNDDNKEFHLLLSTEKVFGGRGPRREGFKTYAWYNKGKRTLDFANGVAGKQEFDRKRYGVGATYRKGKVRGAAEYIKAKGMIFNGSLGGAIPGAVNAAGAVAPLTYLTDNKADGYHIDLGYKVTPKVELGIRYDVLNRGTDSATPALEREFKTVSLGAQYSFNPRTRLIANYEFRDAEAPNLPAGAPPNLILDGMDDRVSVQILSVF
jgi:phosphate-selective porin